MVAAYEYDPFGNPVRTSGVYARENSIRFSGKYFDVETGLSYFGFRYYNASLGRFINRDPLEERGGWNLYSSLKQMADDPYAGASGVEGTSWSTEWEQAQDRLLENTSMPHTTQTVTFDGKRNSGLPGSSENNQKTYSANATGHYAQGGAEGTGPLAPSMSVGNPAAGNADTNLYIYSGNNPINSYDALGLRSPDEMMRDRFRDDLSSSDKFRFFRDEQIKEQETRERRLYGKYYDLIKSVISNPKSEMMSYSLKAAPSSATSGTTPQSTQGQSTPKKVTYYKWMLITFYSGQKSKVGRNSWNKKDLTEMDAAVGLAGYTYNSKKRYAEKTEKSRGNDDYAYAPLTEFTIIRGAKGADRRTVRDGGSGWTYPRKGAPDGVAQDEWLDLWTATNAQAIKKGPEVDLVKLTIDSSIIAPTGWSSDPNVQIPKNLESIREALTK